MIYNKLIQGRKILYSLFFCMISLFMTGCLETPVKIVLHAGLGRNEVFRIEQSSCYLPELLIYLTTSRNKYENVYGESVWDVKLEGVTLGENIKEVALAQLSQIKAMNILADKEGVDLTKEEKQKVEVAAGEYYTGLTEEEKKLLDADIHLIEDMYYEYARANKVYYYLIKDINPEVSDDEARTITVEHILIKTYSLNENGEKSEYTPEEKRNAYNRAREALSKVRAGEDFNELVKEYNEDSRSQYSFGKGEMDQTFEAAAFNLGKDEISNLVETQYGYHIIKCITTFNQEETDANKIKIVQKKRDEVFEEKYTSFQKDLTKALNEGLLKKINPDDYEAIENMYFFEIYKEHMGEDFENLWF